jgi:competence protein ComEC
MAEGQVRGGATFVAVGVVRGGGVFRVDHIRTLQSRRAIRFVIREVVRHRIEGLYGDRAPLVEAMILGRRYDVDVDLRATFVSSGLAHLLAISGLHVGIFAGWVTAGARRVFVGSRPWLVGAGVAWLYVLLLGFPVPATRAAAFISIASIARVRERHPPLEAVLSVAILMLVSMDPTVVESVGAWLSASAVWSTVRVGRMVDRIRRTRLRPLVQLLAASVGATIGTAPVTAYAFGSVAPIGVLANLLAVPLATLAVPAVFLSLIAGATVAGGSGLLLAGMEGVAWVAARVPGGHLDGVPGIRFALPWIVLAALAWWCVVRKPRLSVVVRRTAYVFASGLWLTVSLPSLRRVGPAGWLEIHVLDVGQGDAIAVRTPMDRWVLIDGGPRNPSWDAGRSVVLPFLRRHGVDELAAVILSHGDADHLGGLPSVLGTIPTTMALEPGLPLGTGLYLDFQGVIDSTGARWLSARTGDTLVVDSVVFAVVHPQARWSGTGLGPNENSVVVRLSYRDFDALLTGDIGEPAELHLLDAMRPVEVLKVGHHGSRGGTTDAWLARLQPAVAIISVGENNRYGHPAPEVLNRLAQEQIVAFRTDLQGPVTVRTDGRYYDVTGRNRRPIAERLICLLPTSLRSSVSSPNRKSCTPRRPENSRVSYTISP